MEQAFRLLSKAGDAAHWTDLLHILVEDENVEDWWFDLNDAETRERYDAAEQWERDIFDALAALPEGDRLQVIRDVHAAEVRRFS